MENKRAIGLVVLLIAVGAFAWGTLRPHEPMYDGKPLSFWLSRYDLVNRTETSQQEADNALQAIGTNAVPMLVRMIQSEDSRPKLYLLGWLRKQHVLQIRWTSAPARRYEAVCGFQVLRGKGSQAVPDLIEIYQRDIQRKQVSLFLQAPAVAQVLGAIGPSARDAIPVLSASLPEAPDVLKIEIIDALGKIHSAPEIAVPALIQCLKDPSESTLSHAVDALVQFGGNAKKAVPALQRMLQDNSLSVRITGLRALKQIDPEFAANMEKANPETK